MSKRSGSMELVVSKANQYMRADMGSREGRQMLHTFVGALLMETNNYRGFRYLCHHEVPPGQLPGILFDTTGEQQHKYPDDSRINFY